MDGADEYLQLMDALALASRLLASVGVPMDE
jgi:hypothetical protein